MAKKPTSQTGNTDAKELNGLVSQMQASMAKLDSLAGHLSGLFEGMGSKVHKIVSDDLPKWKQNLEGVKNLSEDLSGDIKDYNRSQDVKNKMLQKGYSQQVAELEVSRDLALAHAKRYNMTKDHVDEINKEYDKTVAIAKKRDKMLEGQKKEIELSERIKEYDKERSEILEKIKVKQELLKDIITDQRAAQAVFIGSLIKTGDELKELMTEFRAEGLTVTQAMHEMEVASGATMQNFFTSGASLKDNAEIMGAMTKEMGALDQVTSHTVGEVGKLSKTLGISNQLAGQLQGQFQSMAGSTAESATQTMEYAGALAKAAHVAPGAVMAEIAGNAEATAVYAKDGGKNIATAAVAAKKLGVEFGTITKMSEGLLDFENSINKQMEASVLLGREINLDKAREASLNGDLVGATEEMLKNVGGEAEFNKMNVVQRKALADSMGVSVQELSKMVKNQDKLKNLTEEQREALADGSMTMDEVLANSKGVGERLGGWAMSLGSGFMSMGGIAKGLKDSLDTTKGLIQGWKSGAGLLGKMKGSLTGGLGGAAEKGPDAAGGAADKAKGASEKADKVKTKGGFKESMKNLADGFKEMGSGKVLAGIMNTLIAGPALVVALPAIPFLLFMGMTPLKQLGDNFLNLAIGLEFMGSGKVLAGVGVMALAGPALALGVLALPFLAFMSLPGVGKGIEAGLKGLASGMTTLGNPGTAIAILIGIGLLAAFGAALIPLTYAVSLLTPVLEAMGNIIIGVMQAIPPIITAIADGFVKMFGAVNMENIGPLLLLGPALVGIGLGLSVISAGGLGALPIIGALVALGVVAPALTGLANAIFGGGGGETEKEDKMDLLIEEVRSLKTEMASITVNLDGKKVGDALRGSMNTSRVR